MKKLLFTIFIFFVALNSCIALELPVDVTADSVILVDRDKNEVIYEKNPDKEQILASLTKIMTVYTALQKVNNLYRKVTITEKDIANLEGFTCIKLEEGDVVTYQDLLYATNLTSAADAAQALALHISGSMQAFVDEMNANAKELGLKHTHFSDTYGRGDDNVSTAREMSILLNEALKNETFERIFNTTYYKMSNGLESINYTRSIAAYHGLDTGLITGNKSGYTPEAGLLLASTATINGVNYMLITMHSKENEKLTTHVIDSWKIYNYISTHKFTEHVILRRGQKIKKIHVSGGTTSDYVVTMDHDVKALLTDVDYENVKIEYHIADYITPNNKIGDNLGFIDIKVGDQLIESINIYLRDDIFSYQKRSIIALILIISFIFLGLTLLFIRIVVKRKKKF
jgi:D-alanyl-D-alanine carboxypeptidase (penicillin-binding protein 5/6)